MNDCQRCYQKNVCPILALPFARRLKVCPVLQDPHPLSSAKFTNLAKDETPVNAMITTCQNCEYRKDCLLTSLPLEQRIKLCPILRDLHQQIATTDECQPVLSVPNVLVEFISRHTN